VGGVRDRRRHRGRAAPAPRPRGLPHQHGAPGAELAPAFAPRDTIFLQQGTVAIPGGGAAPWNWHWVKANFPAAWDVSRGSANVKVAVIDSEFDTAHVELQTKLATGRNFDSGTAQYLTGDVRSTDFATSHGTHVAGLVGAASDNGNGTPGACFDCVVIPYKISTNPGPFTSPNVNDKFVRDLSEALVEAARSDAAVINLSLGTTRDYPVLRDAIAFARNAGKVLVAAAGNFQQSNPGVAVYPGAYPGVIAVAATTPSDAIAPFSQNGDYVDVAAPGSPILSTWDSRIGTGADPAIAPTHGIGFRSESGTSMASPIVAGLAALMKAIRPDLTAAEVEGLVKASALDLGAAGPDPVYGAGRIDARKALDLALAYVRPAPAPSPPSPRPGRARGCGSSSPARPPARGCG
jgi:subtilisin family serine protease